MIKSANQYIEFSDKVGGARVVFEGHPYALVGGYNFDLNTLPNYPNVLPAGTPVYCDEEARTITPHYAFAMYEAVTAEAGSKATDTVNIKVAKDGQGSRVKVGMALMEAPATITTTGKAFAVSAVDTSNANYDVVTIVAGTSAISFGADAVLVEAAEAGTGKKVKVVPNALLDRDIVKDANAKLVNATGIWSNDRPVLENRIPPIAKAVKAALLENGCYFRFSTRK